MDYRDSALVRHHSGIYSSDDEFLALVLPFLRTGMDADDEPDPVAIVDTRKTAILREALGGDVDKVKFFDASSWYHGTPANGLATALHYYTTNTGANGKIHMTGEPVWEGRSDRQVADWIQYEAVITELFAGYGLEGMCLYDTRTAPAEAVAAARCTHPTEWHPDGVRLSPTFTEPAAFAPVDRGPLPKPPPNATRLGRGWAIGGGPLVVQHLMGLGLSRQQAERVELAVAGAIAFAESQRCDDTELRLWTEQGRLTCEVRSRQGHIPDPFLGFRPPAAQPQPSDGLWHTRQICDFVDLWSDPDEQGWAIRMEATVPA